MSDTTNPTPVSYAVYTGVWTNWSRGSIMGATSTLSQADANLLIAFIAFFVALVGTRFWRISCFIAHVFIYSRSQSQDGLYHQRQALLRNAFSSEAGLLNLFQLSWAWRKTAERFGVYSLAINLSQYFTSTKANYLTVTSTLDYDTLPYYNDCLADSSTTY